MEIFFDNRTTEAFMIEYENIIKLVIDETLKSEGFVNIGEVSVSIVTNSEIRKINKKFRGIDKETDVLSFPLNDNLKDSDYKYEEELPLGDIIISLEKAKEQSKAYGHNLERELGFLTAHSVLHLLGYDHMTEEEEQEMNFKQEQVLQRLKLLR